MNNLLKADFERVVRSNETASSNEGVIGTFSRGAFTLLFAVGSAFAIAPSDIDKLKSGFAQEEGAAHNEAKAPLLDNSATQVRPLTLAEFRNDGTFVLLSPSDIRMQELLGLLMSHKGDLLSQEQLNSFQRIMNPFTQLEFCESMVSYSKLNKTIYTLLTLDNGIELRVTQFVDRKSSDVAFSIYYNGENLLAGSGPSDVVASKTLKYIGQFDDYVRSLS